ISVASGYTRELLPFPTRRSSDLAEELARLVMSVPQSDPLPVRLYEPDDSLPEKIAKVAAAMYGVEEIDYRQEALDALERYEKARSEEHTSELQSRENLVCRLLLE